MSRDEEIPELGRPSEVLRHNPAVALERLPLSSEDYFVWTRVDGRAPLREVILMAGFAREKTIAILRRLRNMGALLREGETPESIAAVIERRRPALTPSRGMAAVTPRPAPAQVAARPAAAQSPAQARPDAPASAPSRAPIRPPADAASAAPASRPRGRRRRPTGRRGRRG